MIFVRLRKIGRFEISFTVRFACWFLCKSVSLRWMRVSQSLRDGKKRKIHPDELILISEGRNAGARERTVSFMKSSRANQTTSTPWDRLGLIHLNALSCQLGVTEWLCWWIGPFIPQTTMNHSVPSHASVARDQLYRPNLHQFPVPPYRLSCACELLPDAAMTICNEDTCVRINWKFKREQAHRGADSIIVINKFDVIIVYFGTSLEYW